MDPVEAESSDQAGNPQIASAFDETVKASRGTSPMDAIVREVRSRPFGYGVLAVALVIGPILITMIFPDVTPVQAIVGGLAFGVYLAICAVPQKFM